MKKYIIISILLIVVNIQGQTIASILTKSSAVYSKDSYKIDITYSVFKGLTGSNLIKSYEGQFIKHNKNLYNKIKATEFILNNNNLVKINNDEKAMQFSNKTTNMQTSFEMDTEKLLQTFDYGKLTQDDNYWYCELIAKEKINIPYSSIVMIIEKKTFSSKKQILNIKQKVNFSVDKRELAFVRMEISFDEFEKVSNQDIKKTNINEYLINLGSEPTLTKKYLTYKLIK